MCDDAVLELNDVTRRIDGSEILRDLTWTVRAGEHWVVLGPNGSGKTTAARIASLRLHPIRPLLGRVGYAAAALADQLRPTISASDVVMTAKNGALETWWHDYDEADRTTALESLARVGVEHLADHAFGTCSSGEKQRVLIARALMTNPALLILDEPTAALDLAGREEFVATLDRLASLPDAAPMVLITHHVDEIPSSFTHCMLMADGASIQAGKVDEILTSQNLSSTFGLDLTVEKRHGRWWAWAPR